MDFETLVNGKNIACAAVNGLGNLSRCINASEDLLNPVQVTRSLSSFYTQNVAFGEVTYNGVPFKIVYTLQPIPAGKEWLCWYGPHYWDELNQDEAEHLKMVEMLQNAYGCRIIL